MSLCGAYATQSIENFTFVAHFSFASARAAFMISFTGTIVPRMLEHAVNAMIRVSDDMRGNKSSTFSATEYGLLGLVGINLQYFKTAPRRAASLFQHPALAIKG